MRHTRPFVTLLALLVSLLSLSHTTFANASADESNYVPPARVARISLLAGDVQLQRAGSDEWESAAVNVPLVEGDRLATGQDSRLEIQIDAHNFVRIDEESMLSIVTLRTEGVALSLSEGTATLRLARFEQDREYFEIDAPRTTLAAEKRGLYRVDAPRRTRGQAGEVSMTVRDGGRARIYSAASGFTLRDGRAARLFFDEGDGGDWELTQAARLDAWDEWIDQREYYLAQRLRYERRDRYYDSGVWGAEELDAYGEWVNTSSYGYVWRPHATVINNYYNWAPYRYGYWQWLPHYGWTWIAAEPWGWAPYHYGRWVYYNGYWCWSPRNYYSYGHSWWHPALVVFSYTPSSYGNQVCWYPLPPRHPDPVYPGRVKIAEHNPGPPPKVAESNPGPGPGVKGDQALANTKGNVRPPLADPAYLGAVTAMPVKDFGLSKPTAKPAPLALAQTVIKSDPIPAANLPVKRPTVNENPNVKGQSIGQGRPRVRDGGGPSAPLAEQPTGAAIRKPGVELDNQLRPRLHSGRDPVTRQETGGKSADEKDTGAVTRPVRPFGRPTAPPVEPSSEQQNAPVKNPVRPSNPVRGNGDVGNSPQTGNETQPVRPPRRPVPEQDIYSQPQQQPQPSEPRPRRNDKPLEQPAPVRPDPPRPRNPEPVRPSNPEPVRPQPSRPRDPEPVRQQPQPRPEPPRQKEPPPPPPPPAKNPDPPLGGSKRGTG